MSWVRLLGIAAALLIFASTGEANEWPNIAPGVRKSAAARAYAQWPFRRGRETRPTPPRDIPAGRSVEMAKLKTPLPRPRPDDITGSIKLVPVAPLE